MAASLTIQDLYSVKGKRCLVTGGASGIGYMMASALVQNGAEVIIASRKEKALQEAVESLNLQGPGKSSYIVADIASRAGCDALAAEVTKRWSKLHVLINNSGIAWSAPFHDFPEEKGWDKVLATNLKGPYYCASLADALAKDATNTDPGRVIIVSSIDGLDPKSEGSPLMPKGTGSWSYNASKAAANHLTKSLAITLGPRMITVNAINPGFFPSRMTSFGSKSAGIERMAAGYPMKRTGQAEDVAGATLFLSSKASAHVSGLLLVLDGGLVISGNRRIMEGRSKL
ncbi:rhamnolipids biosynthesis 3-oxoacyl-reductase [Atractiella rhizophila]|nr:rhamnolipids biosynthesis 3-oxoacyl-reductase [Atractiella rhizophila]